MNTKLANPAPGLLPYAFKKLGALVMILSILPALLLKFAMIRTPFADKEILRLLTMNGFILGLLFIAMSRDREEDELTLALRLKSIGLSFSFGTLFTILNPFLMKAFDGRIETSSAQSLVLIMLINYLLFYYVQKAAR